MSDPGRTRDQGALRMEYRASRIPRRRFLALAGAAAVIGLPGLGLCKANTPVREVRILSTHDHDPGAFTQGLLLADGVLYESTGGYGRSDIRKVEPRTGRVLQKHRLPDNYFGEGLARVGGTLYQLTWRERTAFLYDAETLRPTERLGYQGEGWGLAWDGQRFLMSDGSAHITTRSRDFRSQAKIAVTSDQGPVEHLNELEFMPGALLANVWQTWRVAYIDMQRGKVALWLDLTPLRDDMERRGEKYGVANGLAWDRAGGRLLVTGKNWPNLYAVRF